MNNALIATLCVENTGGAEKSQSRVSERRRFGANFRRSTFSLARSTVRVHLLSRIVIAATALPDWFNPLNPAHPNCTAGGPVQYDDAPEVERWGQSKGPRTGDADIIKPRQATPPAIPTNTTGEAEYNNSDTARAKAVANPPICGCVRAANHKSPYHAPAVTKQVTVAARFVVLEHRNHKATVRKIGKNAGRALTPCRPVMLNSAQTARGTVTAAADRAATKTERENDLVIRKIPWFQHATIIALADCLLK